MSNLLKLLQPQTYKSKIKLYCLQNKLEIKKFDKSLVDVDRKKYICIVEKEVNIK